MSRAPNIIQEHMDTVPYLLACDFCQQVDILIVSAWWYSCTMEQDTTRQTIRLPDPLLARLRAAAEADHRSVHGQLLHYIERGLAADERAAKRAASAARREGAG